MAAKSSPTVEALTKKHATIERKRWALEIRREKRGGWMMKEACDYDEWRRDEDELQRLNAASTEIVNALEASGRMALANECRWYDVRPPAKVAAQTELIKWTRDLETWPRPIEERLAVELERRADPALVFDKGEGLYNVAVRRNQWEDEVYGRRILFALAMLRAAASMRRGAGGEKSLRARQAELLWWVWSYGRRRIDRKLLLEQAEASVSAALEERGREAKRTRADRDVVLSRASRRRISESWRRKLLRSARELEREERQAKALVKTMRAESDPLRALGVYGRRRDLSMPIEVYFAEVSA